MSAMTHSLAKKMRKPAAMRVLAYRWHNYVGSVLFFKHLILLTVLVLIITPWFFVADLTQKSNTAQGDAKRLEQTVAELKTELAEKTHALEDAEAALLANRAALAGVEIAQPENKAALLAEPPAYQALYPDFYAPQPLDAAVYEEGVIYLTFDDGPSDRTPEILQILEEKNAKATFFVVGQTKEENLQYMREIVAAGHTIGMHTYSHRYKDIYASVDAYLEDMYAIFTQIRDTTGVTPTVFRFPGGSVNAHNHAVYQENIAEMLRRGFVPHDWNIASADAGSETLSSAQILYNVVSGAKNKERGVVLMHDSEYKYTTVEALPAMIDQLLEMGFKLEGLRPDTQPILFSYPD